MRYIANVAGTVLSLSAASLLGLHVMAQSSTYIPSKTSPRYPFSYEKNGEQLFSLADYLQQRNFRDAPGVKHLGCTAIVGYHGEVLHKKSPYDLLFDSANQKGWVLRYEESGRVRWNFGRSPIKNIDMILTSEMQGHDPSVNPYVVLAREFSVNSKNATQNYRAIVFGSLLSVSNQQKLYVEAHVESAESSLCPNSYGASSHGLVPEPKMRIKKLIDTADELMQFIVSQAHKEVLNSTGEPMIGANRSLALAKRINVLINGARPGNQILTAEIEEKQ